MWLSDHNFSWRYLSLIAISIFFFSDKKIFIITIWILFLIYFIVSMLVSHVTLFWRLSLKSKYTCHKCNLPFFQISQLSKCKCYSHILLLTPCFLDSELKCCWFIHRTLIILVVKTIKLKLSLSCILPCWLSPQTQGDGNELHWFAFLVYPWLLTWVISPSPGMISASLTISITFHWHKVNPHQNASTHPDTCSVILHSW